MGGLLWWCRTRTAADKRRSIRPVKRKLDKREIAVGLLSTKATVYLYDELAGYLERDGERVQFQYDEQYVDRGLQPLSWSLPLQKEPYVSEHGLPAYFSGLCSEGWLRQVQTSRQGIHPDNLFTLLINNGLDLPGAVVIVPAN